MKKVFFLTVLAALLFAGCRSAVPCVPLPPAATVEQRLNYEIRIPQKAGAIEKFAAQELKNYLAKCFSKPVRLNGKTPEKVTFLVASQKNLPQGAEFSVTFRPDNVIWLGGFDDRISRMNPNSFVGENGTLLAVYYFLQKYGMIEVYHPGPGGLRTALDPELKYKAAFDAPVPSFELRTLYRDARGIAHRDFCTYARMRLCHHPEWTQRQYYYSFLNKWNKRFKNKPEYFAMHEGRRINESYPRHFPCTSNPAVLKQVVDDLIAAKKKSPRIKAIRLFSDAPVAGCTCPQCLNADFNRTGCKDSSEVVYNFFSRIAQGVQKVYPDMVFHIQTKGESYSRPPESAVVPPHTVVSVLTGHFVPGDCKATRELCAAWQKRGAKVMTFSYPRAPEMLNFPLMNAHRIADHLKALQGYCAGFLSSENRYNVPWSFSALNMYVHTATAFDTALDTDKLIGKFCRAMAPGAEEELEDFYSEMESLLKNAGFRDDPQYNCYRYKRLEKAQKLLAVVQKKAKDRTFVDQLAKDFSSFAAEMKRCSANIERYESRWAAQREALEAQKELSLPGKMKLDLEQMAVYEEFFPAYAQVSSDGRSLKIKVVCTEPEPEKVPANYTTPHIGNIWGDDVIELFLGPESGKHPYLHLAVNSKANFRTQWNSAPEKAEEVVVEGLKCTAEKTPGAWQVSIELPIPVKCTSWNGKSALKATALEGKAFTLGICRYRNGHSKKEKTQCSVLREGMKNFHDPAGRFRIKLEKK